MADPVSEASLFRDDDDGIDSDIENGFDNPVDDIFDGGFGDGSDSEGEKGKDKASMGGAVTVDDIMGALSTTTGFRDLKKKFASVDKSSKKVFLVLRTRIGHCLACKVGHCWSHCVRLHVCRLRSPCPSTKWTVLTALLPSVSPPGRSSICCDSL
jgi:hypothetical protein